MVVVGSKGRHQQVDDVGMEMEKEQVVHDDQQVVRSRMGMVWQEWQGQGQT